jgi:hypothetical protein
MCITELSVACCIYGTLKNSKKGEERRGSVKVLKDTHNKK